MGGRGLCAQHIDIGPFSLRQGSRLPLTLRQIAFALCSIGSTSCGLELENIPSASIPQPWESEPELTKHRHQADVGCGQASATGH